MKKISTTRQAILDAAQALIQTRGYNDFSYADIATLVAIRKASIHHHFPAKADLAIEVIRQYRETFNHYLFNIAAEKKSWLDHLRSYSKLYERVLQEHKLCLCGMLAADIETLPPEVKVEIQHFFTDNVTWLTQILALHYTTFTKKRLQQIAWQIISSLQGAMLMARSFAKVEIFSSAVKELLLTVEQIA